MDYLNPSELERIGFSSLGREVRVSRDARIHGAPRICLGDFVRIDAFCVLSAGAGGIVCGRNVHIASFCSLVGRGAIVLEDFAGLSSRVAIYSSSDDYSGNALTNPTVPAEFANVMHAGVTLGRHCIVGCGSVVLPGVSLGEGSAVGALSLVTRAVEAWTVVGGTPARVLGQRSRGLLRQESLYLRDEARNKP